MAKRGPKTEAGKAVIRLNAVRHGVLSTTPVIPDLERQEDWEAHLSGVMASLAPQGQLEMALAERVALALWRLRRVSRYERESVAVAQERAEGDLLSRRTLDVPGITGVDRPPTLDHVRDEAELAKECGRLLESLPELPDDAALTGQDAYTILDSIAEHTREVDLDDFDLPGVPEDVACEDFEGFTAGLVRQGIAAIASKVRRDPTQLVYGALARTKIRAVTKAAQAERLAEELDRLRRERLLPDAGTLEKLIRYESHLSRQLYQALHELEALQARRRGEQTPLARVDVQGLPEG